MSAEPQLLPSVNVAGYMRAEMGVGEAARLMVATLERARVAHSVVGYHKTVSRQALKFHDTGPAIHDVNLVCVNADEFPNFARDMGRSFFQGRYTIGYWHWEVDPFPNRWRSSIDLVDEIWTGSCHTAQIVSQATDKPVHPFPPPIIVPPAPPEITRAAFGLPDRYLFLFTFDFLSVLERKNPLAVLRAFQRAFPTPDDRGPLLLLKSINGPLVPAEFEGLRSATKGRPDILLLDRYLSPEENGALTALCDCYVSLHRAEGFGLTMAEAMGRARPVIATDYSGNTDFMGDETSLLVPFTLTEIPHGCDPYPVGGKWAEADVAVAGQYMRRVYEDREYARALGQRAQRSMIREHSPQARAGLMRERLTMVKQRASSMGIAVRTPRPPSEPEAARVAIVSTPRAGNTWARSLLSEILEAKAFAVHEPDELVWEALPEKCVIQLHWYPTPELLDRLEEQDVSTVTVTRHPLDVLLSILHYSQEADETYRWLGGQGGHGAERRLRGVTPVDQAFLDYATSDRARALLGISPAWIDRGGIAVRYEDLVASPEEELIRAVENLGFKFRSDPESAVRASSMRSLRERYPGRHFHFWQGQPGLWRVLLPPATVKVISDAHHEAFQTLGYKIDPDPSLTHEMARRHWLELEVEGLRQQGADLRERLEDVAMELQREHGMRESAEASLEQLMQHPAVRLVLDPRLGTGAVVLARAANAFVRRFPRLVRALRRVLAK